MTLVESTYGPPTPRGVGDGTGPPGSGDGLRLPDPEPVGPFRKVCDIDVNFKVSG